MSSALGRDFVGGAGMPAACAVTARSGTVIMGIERTPTARTIRDTDDS
jgi:hypothetical protein